MAPTPEPVEVAAWTGDLQAEVRLRQDIWAAWLHGSVAAVHRAGRLLLVVPMAAVTPAARRLALRLYAVGAVVVLD